jgi:hypothetical protein
VRLLNAGRVDFPRDVSLTGDSEFHMVEVRRQNSFRHWKIDVFRWVLLQACLWRDLLLKATRGHMIKFSVSFYLVDEARKEAER